MDEWANGRRWRSGWPSSGCQSARESGHLAHVLLSYLHSVREAVGMREELVDLVRALSGAFLFAIPLLFTMEMWWLGTYISTWRMLALLAIAFLANLGLARAAGFKRKDPDSRNVDQALDALAVGVVASLVVLLALNQLSLDEPLGSILGKIVIQVVPLSLGASVANVIFARGASRTGDEGEEGKEEDRRSGPDGDTTETGGEVDQPKKESAWTATVRDVGATATGAVFLGFSVAPTDEIPMLAGGLSTGHLLALVALTLAITYAIVFASGFDSERGAAAGPFQSPANETALAYAVSLLISFGAILLFGHATLSDPLGLLLMETVVLGMPTAIGGAAGRLVI